MHNGVQLRLAANNILLVRKWNLAFLLLAIAWRENALTTLPEDDHWKKKKTPWPDDKTILNSILSQNIVICPKAEGNNWSTRHWQITIFW